MPSDQITSGAADLRECAFSSAILALSNTSRLRFRAMRVALQLEGGEFFSSTARRIMLRHFGVGIGAYSYGSCFEFGAFNRGVTVGRFVSTGPGVLVYRRNHPIEALSTHPFFYNSALGYVSEENIPFRPLEIGHDSWIGARTIITPGCSRVGIGSVIGAGSVVTKDVPDFAIVAGSPARVIRMRFPEETCRRILASEWWNLSITQCIPHLDDMTRPLAAAVSEHPLLRVRRGN